MIDDEKLFNQIMQAISPFLSHDMLSMLWHTSDTNLNEAMNRSISSFAPKDRTFSRTMSLNTRVCIAVGVNILGHYEFWKKVLDRLGVKMSDSLEILLKRRDGTNAHRIVYRRRPDVKRKRKAPETVKIAEGINKRKQQIQDGTYSSGIAIAAEQQAKKIVKELSEAAKEKNRKAPDNKKVCKFYPHFCKRVGHNSASSKECAMHGKSKEEKDDALKTINDMMLASQIAKVQSECKCGTIHTIF